MSNRSGNQQIYVMDMDGSRVTRLTDGPGESIGPAFSPGGTKIAFTSNRGGSPQIYVMNADGSYVVRLTAPPGANGDPRLQPRRSPNRVLVRSRWEFADLRDVRGRIARKPPD